MSDDPDFREVIHFTFPPRPHQWDKTPHYWMYETTGVLRPVIEAYFLHHEMTATQIAIMRDYLRQWIMSPAWDRNPYQKVALRTLRETVEDCNTRRAIDIWLALADCVGLDPL
jgi:hypothetical protein